MLITMVCLLGLVAPPGADGRPSQARQLQEADGGKVWTDSSQKLRLKFTGSDAAGYDVSIEAREGEHWRALAAFPPGAVWTVYDQWDDGSSWEDKWYSRRHVFKAAQLRVAPDGCLEALGRGDVGGQPWDFLDRYSFEHAAVKVVRHWHHASPQNQSPITLVTAVRVPVGGDPRTVFPAILYNDNPGAYPTRMVPHLANVAFAKAVYEEHRYPVPFVNVESTVANRRVYVSLLAEPSKVPHAHKGDDQWWSLGLEWRWGGEADLLSISGAVTTNGMNSMVYGHRNGFDPYEDAYIDVKGDITFEKTFYIDCGIAPRVGYAFRETLWKAFDLFQPVKTPSIPFREAMDLKFKYAAETFHEEPDGAAGFPLFCPPRVPAFQRFQYGWVGQNLAIAYAFLAEAERTGNADYRRVGLNTVGFFVEHCRRDTPGLPYMDYGYAEKRWLTFLGLPDWPPSLSSRQLGETLEHLADLIVWGKQHGLAEVDRWQALLVECGNFLVKAERYKGMYPRTWYPDGRPVGWEGGVPATGTVTAAGAHLVSPLAKLYQLTGDRRYLETAESVMRAYYEEYGRDLKQSPSGATLDAASEDKEAGQGMLHGALALYEVTKKPECLEWARDAADWLLTWYYMYDVQLPASSILHGVLNTVGWTAISVQNEEIDECGAFMAPDFYQLGKCLDDQRYQDIGRTIFAASTQTIARPGVMVGLSWPGMQYEHYNHTNCTYVRGGTWRGSPHTESISWVLAATLFHGTRMAELGAFSW
jgi:hypothetical protein